MRMLAIAVLTAAAGLADGRVGETKAEIEARYGSALGPAPRVDPAEESATYRKNGYTIAVQFKLGISVCEIACRKDPDTGRAATLTEQDATSFLDANRSDSRWPEDGVPRRRYDGKMVALIGADLMMVCRDDFYDRAKALMDDRKAPPF